MNERLEINRKAERYIADLRRRKKVLKWDGTVLNKLNTWP